MITLETMKRAKEIDKYLAAHLKTLDKHKVAGFEKAEDMKLFCDFLQKENIPFEHNSRYLCWTAELSEELKKLLRSK